MTDCKPPEHVERERRAAQRPEIDPFAPLPRRGAKTLESTESVFRRRRGARRGGGPSSSRPRGEIVDEPRDRGIKPFEPGDESGKFFRDDAEKGANGGPGRTR